MVKVRTKKKEAAKKTPPPFLKRSESAPFLTGPQNSTTKRFFVAATRQNDGKTTTSLGLFGAMQSHFERVGYIKPIGQRYVDVDGTMIDEDSVLLDSIYHTEVPIEAMSPIAVDSSFTRRYLRSPQASLQDLIDRLCRAFDRASYERDLVIIEGSGHAGVGSVFDLSNAQVAKILGASAIIVSQGGIGRPIDEIALNKALFDKFEVPVIGAILNKVLPDKIEAVADYAGRGLKRLGIPLLGVLPVQKELTSPNLNQIVEEIKARWLNGRSKGMNERIHRVVIGAMTAKGLIDYLQPGVLVITPGDREDIILSAIASGGIAGAKLVSGIILTRNILPHPKLMEMLGQTDIPVAICADESYSVASRINNMTVKTQPQDSDKIPIIKKLALDHIDTQRLVDSL